MLRWEWVVSMIEPRAPSRTQVSTALYRDNSALSGTMPSPAIYAAARDLCAQKVFPDASATSFLPLRLSAERLRSFQWKDTDIRPPRASLRNLTALLGGSLPHNSDSSYCTLIGLTLRLNFAKARLLEPAKSSAARRNVPSTTASEADEPHPYSHSRSASRSLSPKKEDLTVPIGKSVVSVAATPAAGRTYTAVKKGKKVEFLKLATVTRSRNKLTTSRRLHPVTTFKTAHASSPLPHEEDEEPLDIEFRSLLLSSPLSSPRISSKATRTERTRPVQPGMERGFAMSTMAELVREYTKQHDEELSVFSRATTIAGKRNLETTNVMDRGVMNDGSRDSRFALETGFRMRIERTIIEMQAIIARAATLVQGWEKHFIIDPHQVLTTGLRGSSDIRELNATWMALSSTECACCGFVSYF
ncbi:hypothetical protein C8R45DRAFT_1077091 [Mycena sanguinolenta]|nr:hypothetical protein C8R45DRAFT_1077091 [Mycena sanguinolenta]